MKFLQPQNLVVILALAALSPAASGAPPLWQQLVPKQQVSAEPGQEYTLTETNGPWLVMATSFTGDEGKAQAEKLVYELRSKFHLPAYYYGMTFEMEDANPGRGINDYGAPIKRRYNRGDSVVQHAVLVGEFPTIDDAEGQKLLTQIKKITPDSLKVDEGEDSAQSLAGMRQLQEAIREKINPAKKRGPMGHAFMTRNPMLPKEYFVPQGVEVEVAKWNEGLEFSLMKCPGKYSIRVATFRGRITLQTNKEEDSKKSRRANDDDPLVAAAQNAHKMAVALRAKGWEAYEFHDRHESYVTVGSFDAAESSADGRLALTGSEAQTIVNTFGAGTPNNIFERPAAKDIQAEEERKRQFNNLFSQGRGEALQGLHPKRFVGLPLDIIPEPVSVPKQTISSAYARN